MARPRVESLNLGGVGSVRFADGGEIQSAICKQPQSGAVAVSEAGLPGDEVHDRAHGGPNRALHAFPIEHYAVLEELTGRALPLPCFGENLSLRGLREADVRAGDVWRLGTARLQVTMPTERCAHPGRLAGEPRILKRIIRDGLCGWYLRVLEPGELAAGDELQLVSQGPDEANLLALHAAMRDRAGDAATLAGIEAIASIAPEWKERMRILHARRARP